MNGRSFGFVSSFSRCFSRISGPHGSGSDKNASLLAASDHSHVSHRSVSCFVVCVHPESEGGAACFTASGENTHTHTILLSGFSRVPPISPQPMFISAALTPP